jgi:hypothetical protein
MLKNIKEGIELYRECDDCKGVFKIPSKLNAYFEKNTSKNIFCPYCNGVYSHVKYKKYEKEILESKRGKIFG